MKNVIKKFLAALAVFVIALVPMANVKAAAQTIDLGPAKQSGKYIAGVTFSYKFTTAGEYLYCVNMHKNTAQNIKADLVTNNSLVDGGLVYILKNGFPYKSITGDNDKDYYITQTAVWWYLDETTGSMNLGDYFKESGSDSYNMRHYVKELVQAGIQHRYDNFGIGNTKYSIMIADPKMTLVDNYYVSKTISVSESENIEKVELKLENAPQGTIIEVGGNNYTSNTATISGTDTFRIKVPATAVSTNNLEINVVATGIGKTMYTANHYHPRSDKMQDVAMLEKSQKNVTSSVKLNLCVASKVTVLKIDSVTKQPLAGAILVLKDANGKELSRWTSTTNAHVFQNLANGTYTIEEESAPAGYTVNNKVTTFTIKDGQKNIEVKIENAPAEVVVNVTKVDSSTNQPLAGAVLVLKNANGEVIEEWTTTTESKIFKNLAYGTYTIVEKSAPAGYLKNDKVYTFTIDKDHLSHQILFENSKEVIVPDTASVSSIIMLFLGIVITGCGLEFVLKNAKRAN